MREAGHYIADVEALRGGLDPRDDASIGTPRFRAIACLGAAADHGGVYFGTAHPHIIGIGLDQAAQHIVAAQAEHEVDALFIAPRHYLGTAIMAVAANGDVGLWPVTPERPYETSQMTAYLRPGRCLARSQ